MGPMQCDMTFDPVAPCRHIATMPRVLIADDVEEICDILSRILNCAGITNAFALTVPEAVALAAEFEPDIALVDLIMPETNGLDLAEKLKASHAGIRLIMVTGAADAEEQFGDVARTAGVDALVQKPFLAKEILQAIRVGSRQCSIIA